MTAKIAICASGDGSNFEAIVDATKNGVLSAQAVGLIVNRPGAKVLARAKRLGVPAAVISPKDFKTRSDWDQAMANQLKRWGVEWVVLAGYLALIGPEVLKAFPRRIVNTHPALLPKFGGEGMYGIKVHEAVLKAGETETGFTVHLIDEVYDRGQILKQERIKVLPADTAVSLAERVKAAENQIYPRILNDLVTGRITTG